MPPLLAHHTGEQALAPLLLLLGSGGVSLLLAIARARLATTRAKLTRKRRGGHAAAPAISGPGRSAWLLYLRPDREYSLTEAAARIGASVKAVHQEASRLVDAGLLADRRLGNVRLLRAATDTPLSRPLTDLLAVTYGPLPVLTDALAAVPGVDRAFIHGSWAARYQGEAGPVPNDVDVLVIGTADQDDLDRVAQQAQRRLGRPVNIRRVRPASWRRPDPGDPFLRSVRERPLVELPLG